MLLKLNHPDCRVWRASSNLMNALPSWRLAPIEHVDDFQPINVCSEHGLDWVESLTCDWHVDWHEVFNFIVVRGQGMLMIADKVETDSEREDNIEANCHVVAKCRIRRGDVIQLWPLRYHMVETRRTLSMLEIKEGNVECRNKAVFREPIELEKKFIQMIETNYTSPK